ncbi:MAG: hypothetical protein IPJ12_07460 [Betaproteobacteria bacterium]|nr:hypothetical protein [Betaproteobacteria bacterium]
MLANLSLTSIWYIELNAARIFCMVILTLLLFDAKRYGLLRAFAHYSIAPFIIGLLIFEVIFNYPPATSIYLWLCISSTYYISIRLTKNNNQKSSGGWALTTALLITITAYTVPTAIMGDILYLFHPDGGPSISNGFMRTTLFREVSKQFVGWLVFAFPLFLIRNYFWKRQSTNKANLNGTD